MSSKLLSVKIKESKIQLDSKLDSNSTCPSNFLIFVVSELLDTKTEESKSN